VPVRFFMHIDFLQQLPYACIVCHNDDHFPAHDVKLLMHPRRILTLFILVSTTPLIVGYGEQSRWVLRTDRARDRCHLCYNLTPLPTSGAFVVTAHGDGGVGERRVVREQGGKQTPLVRIRPYDDATARRPTTRPPSTTRHDRRSFAT